MIAAIENLTPLGNCCFDPSFFGLSHAFMNITLLNEINKKGGGEPFPNYNKLICYL